MLMPKTSNSISYGSILRVVIVALALLFLYIVRDVVGLVFVSVILAAAFDPFVDFLEKRKIPRAISILLIYIILLAIISLVVILLIPPVAEQVGQLARNLPDYYERVAIGINNWRGEGTVPSLPQALSGLSNNLAKATTGVFTTLTGIFGGLISFVSVLVMTFYLAVQKNGLKHFIRFLTPSEHHNYVLGLADKIQNKIGTWLRGQLILCLVIGIAVYVGLTILGVKYALLLGVIAGITEIIPYVGPFIGAIPGVFIAFSDSLPKVIMVAALYFLIQQLENYILVPKVMQKSTGINAVVVMAAILIGGKLGGVVGALLAVPVVSMLEVFLLEKFPYMKQVEEK
jgi:predicted PurR-regulated permease PerM